jgi:hypothetical protein
MKLICWRVPRRSGLGRLPSFRKSLFDLVSTSEFGATTDVRQTPGHEHVIGPVLLGSANSGHSRDSGGLPSCSITCRSYLSGGTSFTGKCRSFVA